MSTGFSRHGRSRLHVKSKRTVAKAIMLTLTVAAGLLSLTAAFVLGPFALRVQRFDADPAAGYHAPFYLYVPRTATHPSAAGESLTLLVQPNNSGTTSDDPEVHRKDAWWTAFGRHRLANELGVALIVPAFVRPAVDWRIYTHALDRDVLTTTRPDVRRLDLQLLAMVDRARASLSEAGIETDERFLIQGFSASGMFANRFAALHPSRVKAVAAGSPGGWPIAPVAQWNGEALLYPAGIADIEQLAGQPFDSLAWVAMPQLIVMGSLDENDSVDFRDGWDEDAAETVDRLFGTDPLARWIPARTIYRTAGANATFLLDEGTGHDRRALQHHTTDFFREILAADRR